MKILCKCLLVLLCCTPAVAEMTPAERFADVQELRRGGNLPGALRELARLRDDYPHDVDYALARAQVLAQLGRDEEALAELDVAAELAPDYDAVHALRATLLRRQEPEPRRWTVLLGAGYEDLSDNLPSWDNQFAELHLEDGDHRYFVQLARNARYSDADASLGFGAERRWQQGWFAGGDLGLAGDPQYLPELGFSAHVGRTLRDGWVTDLRYRRREYTSATVGSWIGTVEKYYGAWRFAYSYGRSRLHGVSSFGNHVVTVNWYYRDDSSLGITLNDGNEAESLGNGQVLETDVRGITLTGRREVNDRIAVQWWVGTHEQGDFYRRRFLGMAVSIGI